MLASIVTVAFNSEKTIRKAIESVLNQTYNEIEYTVVDGLSTDKTVEIAKEYESAFAKKGYIYNIISEKDNGIYDAMNKGINNSHGEIIGMINSDDWYEPCAVETAANARREKGFDIFYADINLVKSNGEIIVKHSKYDRLPTSRHWNHPTTFVTKETYKEIGAYKNEGIHDDWDFILRARKAGKKTVIENKVLANFRVGGASNDKTFKKCVKRFKDRYRCYRNNGYSRLYLFECMFMEFAKLIKS